MSCSKIPYDPLFEFEINDIVKDNKEVTKLGELKDTIETIRTAIEEDENLSNKQLDNKISALDNGSDSYITLYERDVYFVTDDAYILLNLISRVIESHLNNDEGEFSLGVYDLHVYGNDDFLYYKETSEDTIIESAIYYDGDKLQFIYRENEFKFFKYDSDIGYFRLTVQHGEDEILDMKILSISFENKEYRELKISRDTYISYTYKDYLENNFSYARGLINYDFVWILDHGVVELAYEDNAYQNYRQITYNLLNIEGINDNTYSQNINAYIEYPLTDITTYEYSKFSDAIVRFKYSRIPTENVLYDLPQGSYSGSYSFEDIATRINEYQEDLEFNMVIEDDSNVITFRGKEYKDINDVFDMYMVLFK
jgi:hypothetical protein